MQGMTMSYTPEDQLLEPAISKIREGIADFHARAQARLDAGDVDWKTSHLKELLDLRVQLMRVDTELSILGSQTR